MTIIVCKSCGHKNRLGIGTTKGHEKKTCEKCGAILSAQDRTEKQEVKAVSSPKKAEPTQVIIKETKIGGEFKQSGVLCLKCKSVSSLSDKKCQACKEKLKKNPRTTVYYNGIMEAVQCGKCGKYTNIKDIKCNHCDKKIF